MSSARPLFSSEPPPNPQPTPFAGEPRPHRRWPRVLAWLGGVLAILLLMVGITIAVLLNSARFHNYVLAKVQSAATDKLNTRVDVQNFALHLAPLGLDIYGVTIHGAAPYADPPVLQLQHAQVGITVTSFLHKKWYIDSIRVDHPIVQVFIDKDGNSNLPKPKPSDSASSSNTTIFDLGVRHAVLNQGEVYFNGRPSNIWADLLNLNFNAAFNPSATMYSGNLAYSNGQILYGAYKPVEHSLDAQFNLTPTTFQLPRALLTTNAAIIHLAATASHFDSPIVDAQYQVDVDGAQLAKILDTPSVPAGAIRATGKAHYQQIANQPAINSVQLDGDLASRQLLVHTPTLRTAITNLAAHYSLTNGDAVIHDLRAGVLGGEITADGTMKQVVGDHPQNNVTANIRNVSLAQAAALSGKQPVNVTGVLNADAKAAWGKTFNDLLATVNATVHGSASPRPQPGVTTVAAQNGGPQHVPIESVIHATYAGARQKVTLRQSYVHLPQTDLTLDGTVSQHSALAVHLQANDLSQLAAIADMFTPSKPAAPATQAQPTAPAQPLALSGRATFQGSVTGSTSAPHLTGQLVATNLNVNGTAWKVFRTSVDASPSQASLKGAELEPAQGGRITLDASAGLNKWAFANTSPIEVSLNASQLDIASLAKMAGQNIPVTGTLNTRVNLHGTELNPIGTGTLSLTKVVAYNEPITSIQANFNGTGDNAHATLSIQLPAGSIQSNVDVQPRAKTYTAQVTSSGIDLSKVQNLKTQNLDATGIVAIHAQGQGSFDNPQLTASVQVPTLIIQKQTIKDVNLNLDMANHVANATLTSAAINSYIQAKARVNLTGDYQTEASFDTKGIPLQPLVAVYSPAQASSLSGETELHATVRGPIKNTKALEAHVTIPYLRVNYNNSIQLASAAPLHADYINGVLTLQHGAIRGTDTDINFDGTIPLLDRTAPMALNVKGNVNLQLAQLFNPDIRSSGQLRFNLDSHGASGRDIGGEIDIVDASYASADLPVGLQHGNGVLTLTTDRINIKSFQGTVGGGAVTASGGVSYRPDIQFDLGMSARGVKMLYPEGMREAIDADIHLAGSTDNATLGGTVNLADISFTPAFELTSFAGQFSGGVAAPPSQGMAQNINLDLALHSTNNVSLVSRELSVNGSANLRVRGTAANPVILGRVNLTGGDVVINKERFVLSGGTIQFVNASETQPVININVTTTIQQYDLAMRISGPSDHMSIQYTSDPALPQADIMNLIAFGSTSGAAAGQGLSTAASPPATQVAEQAVAGEVASQVTSRLSKAAGISQLSISPVLGNQSNGGNAGANITIQQRVTGNLFVTFTTNTAGSQQQVIQGQYQVSPRVAVSATRDQNGGFAVDTLIKKTW